MVLEQGWTHMGSEWFWGDNRSREVCPIPSMGTDSTSQQWPAASSAGAWTQRPQGNSQSPQSRAGCDQASGTLLFPGKKAAVMGSGGTSTNMLFSALVCQTCSKQSLPGFGTSAKQL